MIMHDRIDIRARFEERAKMMLEHGRIGRSFHGHVTQVISGSIGFDDWEWGVDLYADDPLVFKKLVYAMRFDEASARFGEFGRFWTGMQFSLRIPDGSRCSANFSPLMTMVWPALLPPLNLTT